MRLGGYQNPRLCDLDLAKYSLRELQQLSERIAAELGRKRAEARRRVREELAAVARREGIGLAEALGVLGDSSRADS